MTLLEQRRTVNQRQSDQRDKRVFQQCIGTYYPRVLLGILLALIALMHTARAQNTDVKTMPPGLTADTLTLEELLALPELKIWLEVRNSSLGYGMRYLPNFDTSKDGGMNAFTSYSSTDSLHIYYCRSQGDIVKMYPGIYRGVLCPGDFNGDGITDYFNRRNNRFYQGQTFGVPPSFFNGLQNDYPEVVYFADINGDGKDDGYGPAGSSAPLELLGNIILGGPDMRKLRKVAIPMRGDRLFPGDNDWSQSLLHMYHVKGKGTRLLTESYGGNPTKLTWNLWDCRLHTLPAYDTNRVDTIRQEKLTTPIAPLRGERYFFHKDSHVMFITSNYDTKVYSLGKDYFELLYTTPVSMRRYANETSLLNKDKQGWHGANNYVQNVTLKELGNLYLFEGDPSVPRNPYARYNAGIFLDDSIVTHVAVDHINIGDVNGDSVGDIAVYYQPTKLTAETPPVFRILLGPKISVSVGSNDTLATPNTPVMSIPNPVQKGSEPSVTITTTTPSTNAELTLYSLRGEVVTTLWRGALSSGTTTIPLELDRMNISRGYYNLRLTMGTVVVDKGLIITE